MRFEIGDKVMLTEEWLAENGYEHEGRKFEIISILNQNKQDDEVIYRIGDYVGRFVANLSVEDIYSV